MNDSVNANLSHRAYELLKTQIIERRLAPDSKLDLPALSQAFGVSRMPLLDAITRLKAEGLVSSRSRVGTYVTPLEKSALTETFEARLMIEDWIVPKVILNLRDADVLTLRALLEQGNETVTASSDAEFDYRAFIEVDQQFHLTLVQLCGNSRIIDFYRSLNSHLQIARAYSLRALARSREGQAEHEAILNAFAARSVEAARAAQRYHTERSYQGVMALLEQRGSL